MGDKDSKLWFTVRGFVSTGRSEGRIFVSLPWFKNYIKETLSFEPFPGTLNLVLPNEEARRLAKMFSKYHGFRAPPKNGYLPGRLYRALIVHKMEGAIVRPEKPGYPENLIEIIAPLRLRDFLSLKDGDEIEVKILFE
ncbi:MAG: DUF120 domain-containing protein [Candidatus Bathyarchaeia archaeon]